MSGKYPSLVIQLQKKGILSSIFEPIDEYILKIISTVLQIKMENEFYRLKLEHCQLEEGRIVSIFTSLLSAHSQAALIQVMRKLLPTFHGFKDLGLLFYNSTLKKFYTLVDAENEQCRQASWMPSSIGICGQILKDKQMKIRDPKNICLFDSKVDAIEGMERIKDFLYSPLFQDYPHNKKVIGIIQFINKCEKCEVTQKDKDLVEMMKGFYGLLVFKAMERQNMINVMLKIIDTGNNIMGKLPSENENDIKHEVDEVEKVLKTFERVVNKALYNNDKNIIRANS